MSPYGAQDGGLACIDCHEPPMDDSECSRPGTEDISLAPTGLTAAASLAVVAWERDGAVEADVSVSNSGVGHLLPSGTTNAVVVLEVHGIAEDASELGALKGPWLPPEFENSVGCFGVVYALKPEGDNRLAPYTTHSSRYVFAVDACEQATIVARLKLCRSIADGGLECRTITSVAREIRR